MYVDIFIDMFDFIDVVFENFFFLIFSLWVWIIE
jgi:hypothetical protein